MQLENKTYRKYPDEYCKNWFDASNMERKK